MCKVGERKLSLPDGLPGSLGRGNAGYKALCSLVGLETRADKQAFVSSQEVKGALRGHETKSKLRLQSTITAFYGSVEARSTIWRAAQARAPIPAPPSIEACILSKYDSGLLNAPVEEGALVACADLFERETARVRWHQPALAALPLIRRDILDWQHHSEDRRRLLALVAFAVSSILGDARLIEWAAGRVPELVKEYGGLLEPTGALDEPTPTGGEEPGADEPAFRASCERLAVAVRQLIDSPLRTESMFDEVVRAAGVVESHRRTVLTGQDPAERAILIDAVFEHIESHHHVMKKLGDAVLPLREHWRAVYLGPSSPDIETLRADMSRLTAGLAHLQATWREADAKIDALWEPPSSPSARRDPRRIALLNEQVDKADRLWRDVELMLSPTDHPFDSQRAQNEAPPTVDSGTNAVAHQDEEDDESSALRKTTDVHLEAQDAPVGDDKDVAKNDDTPTSVSESSLEHKQGDVDETKRPSATSANAPKTEVQTSPSQTIAASAFWTALAGKEPGIAYHIARLASPAEDAEFVPPPPLMAALVLAEHIWAPEGELVDRYAKHLAQIGDFAHSEDSAKDALNLLVIAATLQPALFAPSTGAFSMLGQVELSRPLKPISNAALQISKRCARLQGMDIHRLHVSNDGGDLERRIDGVVDAIKGSAKDAELHRETFVPAQRIWRFWATSGLIHDLVQNVDTEANVEKVQQIVDLYRDEKLFDNHVREIDARLRPKGRGVEVDKRTSRSLRRSLDSLMKHASAWLRLRKDGQTIDGGFGREAIANLHEDLEGLHRCISDAKEATRSSGVVYSRFSAALNHAASAVDRLLRTFDLTFDHRWQEDVSARAILTRDLLLVPGVDVNLDYGIANDSSALLHILSTDDRFATLPEAFRQRLAGGDVAGASLVCDWMAARGDQQEGDFREELHLAVGSIRDETDGKIRQLVGAIEGAYAKELIDTHGRDELAAKMAAPLGNSVRSVAGMAAACLEVESKLTEARSLSVTIVRRELNDLNRPLNEAERSTIEEALEEGNVAGAREILSKLDTGEGIPERTERRDHLVEFIAATQDIENGFSGMERPSLADIDQASRAGECVGGLLFAGVSESGPPSELLDPWYQLARVGTPDESLVKRLFEGLGFVNVNVETGPSSAIVSVASLSERLQCPLHQYGSTVAGKYRVLLNWKPPARDRLIQQAANELGSVIALHFGHLGGERDKFREWSLNRRRQLVVLDETLILFLSTIGAGRMRAFFDCTLPFTCVEPFVTTASLVPSELFYGRAAERDDITARYGSCFVYGGRQIGKTALLRSVEAEFNRPAEGRIAKWIDLKQNEIGDARPPEGVWAVVWRELSDAGVVGPSEKRPDGRNALIERLRGCIQAWLQGDDRQILVLLDEADAFLEADSRNDHFRESTALKGIMDSTERRFKVVFCGLHNVLRTTARANHPLAHLGQPIGVGPLLSNGEWEEARNLVREPLEAIGCRFAEGEPDLYALARTNYYPALIQILGAELTRLVRDRGGPLPYRVTVDDVASVFAGPARDAIREKFQLTLQLDERYEVIAYSLAFSSGHRANDHAKGIERDSLLEGVSQWWREGFLAAGSETELIPLADFEVLLDEMVELGVLRRLPGTRQQEPRYTLRNLNILPLLGNDGEVEQVLDKDRERQSPFDPGAFRARRQSDDRRALLTSEQETRLVRTGGVSMLTGNDAASIADVEGDLDFAMKARDGRVKRIEAADRVGFVRQLTQARPSGQARDLYVVPADIPWGTPWVNEAVDVLGRVKRAKRMSVVFVADPTALWRVICDADELDVDWFEVGPWDLSFLQRWCADLNLTADAAKVRALMDVSGGWPIVLQEFDRSPAKPWERRIEDLRTLIAEEGERFASALGIGSADVKQQVSLLIDYEGFKEEEVADLVEGDGGEGTGGLPLETVMHRLQWASRLRMITLAPEIRFNSFVKHVLQMQA